MNGGKHQFAKAVVKMMVFKMLIWIISIILIGVGMFSLGYDIGTNNQEWEGATLDCLDGCVYAEWVVYGYHNLTKPVFYTECSRACEFGDKYFLNNTQLQKWQQ